MRIEEEGGGVVLVIVSHGMADLVSYCNAPPDHNVEQVRLFLSLRCLYVLCMKLKVEYFWKFCLFKLCIESSFLVTIETDAVFVASFLCSYVYLSLHFGRH